MIVSTDGNISQLDHIEERQSIAMVQKSALAVFGPSSTIDESGPETLILEAS